MVGDAHGEARGGHHEAIVHHYGRDEFLSRLAQPFWFQSFGAVMGMDWHSSGITTSVLGALKRGLGPLERELGIYVCGGRGKHSRKTPEELLRVADQVGIDGKALGKASRLVAKVDSAAVQDGFDLYLHGFIVAAEGHWTVVQQGMSGERGTGPAVPLAVGRANKLRRCSPHCDRWERAQGEIINLTDRRADASRRGQISLLADLGPERIAREWAKLVPARHSRRPAVAASFCRTLRCQRHHDVRAADVIIRRLHGNLAAAAENGPKDFAELLLTPKVGARTVQALALVAEVVHGAPCRFSDPARYSCRPWRKRPSPVPSTDPRLR